jgi:hypothetical protein
MALGLPCGAWGRAVPCGFGDRAEPERARGGAGDLRMKGSPSRLARRGIPEVMAREGDTRIPLADAIRALREELVSAVAEGEGQQVRFDLHSIELELQVQMSREVGGSAGINLWAVSLGGEGARSSSATHTVRLSLEPKLETDAGDQPVVLDSKEAQRPR